MTSHQIPQTMRALLYSKPAQTMKLVDSWPVPIPNFAKDEHLIKVHSVAITNGELTWPFPSEVYKDYSPGVETAGTVVASPPTSKFPIGSNVYLRITYPKSGAARDYAIAVGNELALQPRNLSPEQASSIPVSALTAWQALFVQAGLPPIKPHSNVSIDRKKKILIVGASGSVGVWATQFACLAGFFVVGTSHVRNVAMVRDLGADEVIDYITTPLGQWLKSNNATGTFDLVLDCVTPGGSIDDWHAANPAHGLVLTIVAGRDGLKWTLDRPEGVGESVTGRFFIMESSGAQLQTITELIEQGKVRPVVDSVFELEEYRQAFERVERGKATGKVVIRVQKSIGTGSYSL